MSTVAEELRVADKPATSVLAELIDRWIYVFTAGLLVVVALTGFIPTSIARVAAVQAGEAPPFRLILHAHALVMGSWLLLLLAQATLVATRRERWHRTLGIAGFVLVPAVALTMFLLVWGDYPVRMAQFRALPPAEQAKIVEAVRSEPPNILLEQTRIMLVFPLLAGLALLMRKRDSGVHKRLLFFATVLPLAAATDRIQWLPTTLPEAPWTMLFYPFVALLPLLLWDTARLGRLHRGWAIALGVYLPTAALVVALWNGTWWPEVLGLV